MNNDPADPTNLSVSVDWKLLKEQRKMKVKNFKEERLRLDQLKPQMKKRNKKLGDHLNIKKSLVANLHGDETVQDWPDTRSVASDNNSYVFDKYAQSFDARKFNIN